MGSPEEFPLTARSSTASRVALIAGICLPLALATTSVAQAAPEGPQSASPAAASYHHQMHEETAAAREARLRALLQLRPDQEAALTAFVASTTPAARPEEEDRAAERALPAPARMERMLARMDEVRSEMGQKLEALKTFYSQLTPAQQKAFDALDMRHGQGGHHGGRGGEHHGGMAGQ